MRSDHEVCVLLLAAGRARRFGAPKQLARLDGVSLVRRAARAAAASGARVLVVTGAYRRAVRAELEGLAVMPIWNARWRQGLGDSIACGVRFARRLRPSPRALIVALADQALLTAADFRALIAAHAAAPARIVAAANAAVRGPPCLFPRRHFAELAALRGRGGARTVLERHAASVVAVPMPRAALDIDTPADHARLARASANAAADC